jgi:hypothetical protein
VVVPGVVARTSERRPEREDKAAAPRGFATPLHWSPGGRRVLTCGPMHNEKMRPTRGPHTAADFPN